MTKTPCFLSQPHQLICAPNNWIIATNTGRNCFTLYDPSSGFYKDIRINDIHWDRLGEDNSCGEHFNSVYLKNNRLYVLAHRFKKTSHILEFSYPDCILLERYEIKQRSGLHNIWVDDSGNMMACHSDAGELIEVKSNETIWATGSPCYSRGLAATTDIIIVGDSIVTSTRESRKNSSTVLWVINRKTLNTIDYLQLGAFGSVHEVRILDVADEAHHGKLFTGLTHLEKIIDEHQEISAQQRKEKINNSQEWQLNRHFLKDFNCIINGWTVNDAGWVAPKSGGFTLALAKKSPVDNFTFSLEYSFPESPTLSIQHVSLVVGWRGNDDTNMLAILVMHSAETNSVSLSLWFNENGAWKSEDLLSTVHNTGMLSVTRVGNQLEIICNKSKITKKFHLTELEGSVGVRCLGSQFKNFTITDYIEKHSNNKIQKKVIAMCKKLGVV